MAKAGNLKMNRNIGCSIAAVLMIITMLATGCGSGTKTGSTGLTGAGGVTTGSTGQSGLGGTTTAADSGDTAATDSGNTASTAGETAESFVYIPQNTLDGTETSEELLAFLAEGDWYLRCEGPGPSFRFHTDGTVDYMYDPNYSYDPDEEQPPACTGNVKISESPYGIGYPDLMTLSFRDIPDTVRPRYPAVTGNPDEAEHDFTFYISTEFASGYPSVTDYLMIYPAGNDGYDFISDAFFRADYSADGLKSRETRPEYDSGSAAPWLYARGRDISQSGIMQYASETDGALRKNETFDAFLWTSGGEGDQNGSISLDVDLMYMKKEDAENIYEGISSDGKPVRFLYGEAPQFHRYPVAEGVFRYGTGIHFYAVIGAPVHVTTDENGVIVAMQEYEQWNGMVFQEIRRAASFEEFLSSGAEQLSGAQYAFSKEYDLHKGGKGKLLLIGSGDGSVRQVYGIGPKGVTLLLDAGEQTDMKVTEEELIVYNYTSTANVWGVEYYSLKWLTHLINNSSVNGFYPSVDRAAEYNEQRPDGPYFEFRTPWGNGIEDYDPITQEEFESILEIQDAEPAQLDWKPVGAGQG